MAQSDIIKKALEKIRSNPKKFRKLGSKVRPKIATRLGLLKDWRLRVSIAKKIAADEGKTVQAIYPNDEPSKEDVAFGYLTNNEFIAASDFKKHLDIEIGYVSHSLMLTALGYAKDPDDPKPKYDYKIRGIVKHNFDGVVFWESPDQLLEPRPNFKALQECLKQLKKRKLIDDETPVYGSGAKQSLGKVRELLESK